MDEQCVTEGVVFLFALWTIHLFGDIMQLGVSSHPHLALTPYSVYPHPQHGGAGTDSSSRGDQKELRVPYNKVMMKVYLV